MRFGLFFGIACAIGLHLAVLLFGGLFFKGPAEEHGTLQQVDLFSEEVTTPAKDEEKPEEVETEKAEELVTEDEKPPDTAGMLKDLELSEAAKAPALEAASLSAIEAALSGQGDGGGDFAESLSFSSGGRIGGTAKAEGLGRSLEEAFSLSEIDQKPRVMFQAVPVYPSGMRSVEGVVTILFIVNEKGKVTNPRVEKSSQREFEKPALDAVKQWKFEPAIKEGERVPCKMRVPIRFKPR